MKYLKVNIILKLGKNKSVDRLFQPFCALKKRRNTLPLKYLQRKDKKEIAKNV